MPICTGCGDGLFWSNSDRDPEHPNWQTARNLARTYAHAVAGSIEKMTFNADSSDFELQYTHDKNITEPTVIYVNTELGDDYNPRYANGFDISIEPQDTFEWKFAKNSKNLLEFTAKSADLQDGTKVSIKISPKSKNNYNILKVE